MSRRAQLPLNTVATWSRLIAEPQLAFASGQRRRQFLERSRCVRDRAILAQFFPLARVGKRHHYGIFVHIQTNKCNRLFHDPSPYA
jgi:hypothetical protein